MEFKIQNNNGYLRWENWKNFLKEENIAIEEVDGNNLIILKNKNTGVYRFIAIFIAMNLSIFLYLILLPFILIRFIIGKIFKL